MEQGRFEDRGYANPRQAEVDRTRDAAAATVTARRSAPGRSSESLPLEGDQADGGGAAPRPGPA
jgi:hypothetical protein